MPLGVRCRRGRRKRKNRRWSKPTGHRGLFVYGALSSLQSQSKPALLPGVLSRGVAPRNEVGKLSIMAGALRLRFIPGSVLLVVLVAVGGLLGGAGG